MKRLDITGHSSEGRSQEEPQIASGASDPRRGTAEPESSPQATQRHQLFEKAVHLAASAGSESGGPEVRAGSEPGDDDYEPL